MVASLAANDDSDGLVQDCSISIALAMDILRSCIKPLIYKFRKIVLKEIYKVKKIYIEFCSLPSS